MNDDFDRFLSSALAPAERDPDRQFVARVQHRIALDERLDGEWRALRLDLVQQIAAVMAIAASLLFIGRAAPVAELFARAPAVALAILLTSFALVIALMTIRPAAPEGFSSRLA